MRLIEFKTLDHKTIYLNFDKIVTIERYDDYVDTTVINGTIVVKGDLGVTVDRLEKYNVKVFDLD